jgi:hypothetical protein
VAGNLVEFVQEEPKMTFNIKEFDIEKFDGILARGLSHGLGTRGESVCIEAAICETLGVEHGDDPGCVAGVALL